MENLIRIDDDFQKRKRNRMNKGIFGYKKMNTYVVLTLLLVFILSIFIIKTIFTNIMTINKLRTKSNELSNKIRYNKIIIEDIYDSLSMRELKKSDLEKVIQEHQNDIENKQKELTNLQENNTKLRRRYLNIKMKILPFWILSLWLFLMKTKRNFRLRSLTVKDSCMLPLKSSVRKFLLSS